MAIFINAPGGKDFADISKDESAKRIGERIKKIREIREMTRAELGALVSLDQIRIQQYESGKRKPKFHLLAQIASALGVEPAALVDPNFDSYVMAMYALFEMEEKLGLRIKKSDDGCFFFQFGDGKTDGINRYLGEWYEARRDLEITALSFRHISPQLQHLKNYEWRKKIFDYNMFEWTYPSGSSENAPYRYNEHPINRMEEIRDGGGTGFQLT